MKSPAPHEHNNIHFVGRTTLSVDVSMHCDACGTESHVDALVTRLRCTGCTVTRSVPPATWAELLAPALYEQARSEAIESHAHSPARLAMSVVTERAPVACRCGETVATAAFERGRVDGFVACDGCGARLRVRAVPPACAKALPGVSLLVGEEARPGHEAGVCPTCESPLRVDPRARTALCTACMSVVFLSARLRLPLDVDGDPHVFYAVIDDAAPRGVSRPDVRWRDL